MPSTKKLLILWEQFYMQPKVIFGYFKVQFGTIMMVSNGLNVEIISDIVDGGANMGNLTLL